MGSPMAIITPYVCAHLCVCMCRWRRVYRWKRRRSWTQLYFCFFGIRGDPVLSKRYPNLPSGPNQHTHSRSSCGTIDLAVCWFYRSGCSLKGDWEVVLWCPKAWEGEGGRREWSIAKGECACDCVCVQVGQGGEGSHKAVDVSVYVWDSGMWGRRGGHAARDIPLIPDLISTLGTEYMHTQRETDRQTARQEEGGAEVHVFIPNWNGKEEEMFSFLLI